MAGNTGGSVNQGFYGYYFGGIAGNQVRKTKNGKENRQARASMIASKPLVFH